MRTTPVKKPKITRKKLAVIFFGIPLLSILIFELLSRLPCADIYKDYDDPCYDLVKKYVEPKLGYFPLGFPMPRDLTYADVNTEEFFSKIGDRTIYIPISELKANGRACINHGFVAQELPEKAKRYVTIHENIHLEGEYNEARTNYLAARMEPVGMVQTVAYSLGYGSKQLEFSKLPCQLGRLWFVFKLYFLKFN